MGRAVIIAYMNNYPNSRPPHWEYHWESTMIRAVRAGMTCLRADGAKARGRAVFAAVDVGLDLAGLVGSHWAGAAVLDDLAVLNRDTIPISS